MEQSLHADAPGIFRQKVGVIVRKFLTERRHTWITGKWRYNSKVNGLRGGKFAFALSVNPYATDCAPGKDEMEVNIDFKADAAIKIVLEWSVSVVRPSGEVLITSSSSRVDFELKKEGGNLQYDLFDDAFTSHQQIREKNLLSDGDLHLVSDIRYKILEGGYSNGSPAFQPLLEALKHQIDSPIFPDLTIISADGAEIKTQKLILALSSPVFRAMLENDMEEARTGVIRIKDANTESIKAILAFLVGIEPKEWTFDLAKRLFELADEYELPGLLQRSAIELSKLMTTQNLADVILLAHRHSAQPLLNETFIFLEDNISQATMDGVFVRLASGSDLETLFVKWQAHRLERKNGVELEAADMEPASDEEK